MVNVAQVAEKLSVAYGYFGFSLTIHLITGSCCLAFAADSV